MSRRTYTEGLYYEIRLTAKYFRLMGNQLFEKLNISINFEEFIVLDLVSQNSDLCQRDLAKFLLRDRANTGRILDNLEEKKFVERINDTKNNRLVKIIKITESGKKFVEEIIKKLEPTVALIDKKFTLEEEQKLCSTLRNCRTALEEIVETQI